jgi:hypothetical protein
VIRTLILIGVLTFYAGPYVGQPLRCGGVYDTTHAWIAVDIDALGWHCGDLVLVTVGDDVMLLRVKDSGPLSAHCVVDGGECVPIVGDLPRHVWQWGSALSVRGSIENVSGALRRRLEVER